MKEVHRLKDCRKANECVDLTNRVFAIKLKNLMDDILIKQVFGKVIGHVWVIGDLFLCHMRNYFFLRIPKKRMSVKN